MTALFQGKETIMPPKKPISSHPLLKKHTGHSKHLCSLVARREMYEVAKLAKGAKYVCHICGRAAASASNLCEPVEI